MNEPEHDVVRLPPSWDARHPWVMACLVVSAAAVFAVCAAGFGAAWWGWLAAVFVLACCLFVIWWQGGATSCELREDAILVRRHLRADVRHPLAGIARVVTCRPQTSATVLQFHDGAGVQLPVAYQDRWGTPVPGMIARWLELHGQPGTQAPVRVRFPGEWPYWAATATGQASLIWALTSFRNSAGWSYAVGWTAMSVVFFVTRTVPDLRGRRIAHDWSADPDGPPAPELPVDEQ